MATKIYYNGQEVLASQPTPLVSRNDSMIHYGEKWAESINIQLNGQITGCPYSFGYLTNTQKELIDIFSRDMGVLEIYDDANLVTRNEYCNVKNGVKFGAGNYNSSISYSVDLEYYPEQSFTEFYGVLDPQDEWEFSEERGGRVKITRNISAKGINTSSGDSNALVNAMSFVNARTGNYQYATPFFIANSGNWHDCPKSISEQKNRFNGSYGLSISYDGSTYDTDSNILRYTTDISCNPENGITSLELQGRVQGCALSSINGVRIKYASLDFNSLIQETYSGYLNSAPLSSGIEENPFEPSISFKISYDSFTGANPTFKYRTEISSGDSDIISIRVDGDIEHRGQHSARWDELMDFYKTIDLKYYAGNAYTGFGGLGTFRSTPISSGVKFNKLNSSISLYAEFDDKVMPVNGFDSFNYSYDFKPSLQNVTSKPLLAYKNGALFGNEYYVCDLGYKNRCEFSLKGDAVLSCGKTMLQAEQDVRDFANSTFSSLCPSKKALLEESNITTGQSSLSFSFTWSAESAGNVVVPRSNYKNVNTLRLL